MKQKKWEQFPFKLFQWYKTLKIRHFFLFLIDWMITSKLLPFFFLLVPGLFGSDFLHSWGDCWIASQPTGKTTRVSKDEFPPFCTEYGGVKMRKCFGTHALPSSMQRVIETQTHTSPAGVNSQPWRQDSLNLLTPLLLSDYEVDDCSHRTELHHQNTTFQIWTTPCSKELTRIRMRGRETRRHKKTLIRQ